jgi:Zn-dependent peptidase ImmA (M78 family)
MRARQFIVEGAEENANVVEMFKKFLPLAMEVLEIDKLPKMHFAAELNTGDQPSFGMYVPDQNLLAVALANRHPVDILRTVAHELVHYKQNMNGELKSDSGETGSPHENQAHEIAGVIMRNFNKRYPEYLKSKPL